MFGKKADEYSIVESDGRTGIRKIDENTYQVYWFPTGWMVFGSTIRSVKIDNNTAVVEYVLTKDVTETDDMVYNGAGIFKMFLNKNGDNWNIVKTQYTEK